VRNAEVVVAGVGVRFDGALMASMPRLKAVISAVVGTDAIDIGRHCP
jgi:phosphoglycerate dehydrogenase-like enzyme